MKSSMTSSPAAAALAAACAEYVSGGNATVDEFDRIVRAARNTITGQFCLIKTITRTHRREKKRQHKDLLKRRREYAKEYITEGEVDCHRFKEAMKAAHEFSQKVVFADHTIEMLHRHPVTNNAPGKDRPTTNLRRERQMEGIARAKANGVYAGKGRPVSIDAARVREMKAQASAPLQLPRRSASGGRASIGYYN